MNIEKGLQLQFYKNTRLILCSKFKNN